MCEERTVLKATGHKVFARRIESYRRRQSECVPRFDQSFSGVCEQQNLETSALQRRFLEGKAKRAAKKGGDRQGGRQQDPPPPLQPPLQHQLQQLHPHGHSLTSNLHSSVHVQQKFLKRPADSGAGPAGPGGGGGGASPPGKLQRVGNGPAESLTKFSVEIVQQLEFTSAADSQPQQISTNVTVKALTNASVKSEAGPPLLECKREPDHDFADLDQCAAALEKDAAANFPGFTDLIGDEAGNEIIMSDAFKDLISEISDYPEFMKDFDFEDKCGDNFGVEDRGLVNDNRVKVEDGGQGAMRRSESPGGPGQGNRGFGPRPGGGYGGGELSPAAQTLKQMAEQHQHKQLGLGPRTARSPYAELQDYLAGPGGAFRKQEQVKQEPSYPPSYKHSYSPYGSPGSGGSPGYLPRPPLGGPSPPRPPSGPPPQPPSSANLHINQAQHLHISHPSHGIQVSAGQHMQLSGELGGGHVSVAAHQGMYFGQQGGNSPHHHHQNSGPGSGDSYTVSQSQTINFTQQTLRQRQQQQQQAPASSPLGAHGSPQGGGMGPGVPTSVNGNAMAMGMGMTREHHAKMMQQQQQQMLRAQQHLRPPPPEYKASQGPLGQPQPRFQQPNIRRAMNQPIPPSGPMMRGAGGVVYGTAGGRYAPPGGPPPPPDWRHHLAMQQHQQTAQGQFVRHPNMAAFTHQHHQGGFPMGGAGSMQQQQQLQQQQQQLLRSQQQQQQLLAAQQHPHQIPPHLIAQQNQAMSMQGQMQNIHMNQSQSMSMHNNGMGNQGIPTNGPQGGSGSQQGPGNVNHFSALHNTPVNSVSSSFPGQPADFNLDFLENIQPGDSSNFTAQELLNSLDNDPGFNLQDIL